VPTYTTDKIVYDVSHFNLASLEHIGTDCGGLIVQVCRARSAGASDDYEIDSFKKWIARYKGQLPLGFYVYSYLPYSTAYDQQVSVFRACFELLSANGIRPADAQLGVWLDLESDGPSLVNASTHIKQVQAFQQAAKEAGFTTAGLYSNLSYLNDNFYSSDLASVPVWIAALDLSSSEILKIATQKGWTAYLHQYSWKGSVGYGDLDCDSVLQPIPYGEATPEDIPEESQPIHAVTTVHARIIPPKSVTFIPAGGVLPPGGTIEIQTDVTDSDQNPTIRYTIDNSEPTLNSRLYVEPLSESNRLSPYKGVHVRAAVLAETGKVLARASATYTRARVKPYSENEQKTTSKLQHEEGAQWFLRKKLPDAREEALRQYLALKEDDEDDGMIEV